jgi:hypothetical protein
MVEWNNTHVLPVLMQCERWGAVQCTVTVYPTATSRFNLVTMKTPVNSESLKSSCKQFWHYVTQEKIGQMIMRIFNNKIRFVNCMKTPVSAINLSFVLNWAKLDRLYFLIFDLSFLFWFILFLWFSLFY